MDLGRAVKARTDVVARGSASKLGEGLSARRIETRRDDGNQGVKARCKKTDAAEAQKSTYFSRPDESVVRPSEGSGMASWTPAAAAFSGAHSTFDPA